MIGRARERMQGVAALRALALGVASGLVLALALGAFASPADAQAGRSKKAAKKAADPAQEVLARIGSGTITRGDFEARIDQLPAQFKGQVSTPEQKKTFLDRLIEERIWLETAVANGVEKRPDVQAQLANTRRDLLIRTYLSEAMAQSPVPSDSLIEAYYQAHLGEFMGEATVSVRHIQLKDERTAKQVGNELKKPGADFAALALKYSLDTVSKDRGGDLGAVPRNGMFGALGRQPALAESAFAAPIGVVRGPLQTGLGWHWYEVTAKNPAQPIPLETVRARITQQLAQEGNQAFYQQSLDAARAALKVSTNDGVIEAVLNAKKSAVDMFREAGEQPGADDRIRAYRRVVELYPENEYAPQALFMVGFVESEEKQDYDRAETAFKELVARYPSSELATSAQWMLDNMRSDKTPDFELPGDLGPAGGRAVGGHEGHDHPAPGAGTPK